MRRITPEQHTALAEVTKSLFGTYDTVTEDGVRIERIHGWQATGVRYVDPTKSEEDATIRELSAAAYVFEFMKLCGNNILEADFDDAMRQIGHVSKLLSSIVVRDEFDLDTWLHLQDPAAPAEPAGLPRQDYYGGA